MRVCVVVWCGGVGGGGGGCFEGLQRGSGLGGVKNDM